MSLQYLDIGAGSIQNLLDTNWANSDNWQNIIGQKAEILEKLAQENKFQNMNYEPTQYQSPASPWMTNLLTQTCSDIGSKQNCKGQACNGKNGDNFYKNLKTITQGYNIYKGNPLARIDEGYTEGNVYALDWTNITVQGGSLRHPQDVNVQQTFGCSSSLSTSLMTNSKEYQNEVKKNISVGVTASYGDIGGAFTASTEFRNAEKKMESGETGIAEATAQCNLFRVSYAIPPCLSENIEAGLTLLPVSPTVKQLNQFIDTFGTHALKKVNMGAKFVANATFKKSSMEKFNEEGKTISFSGEVSGWIASVNSSASSSDSSSEKITNSSDVTEEDQYTIGTTLPAGPTIKAKLDLWASNDKKIMGHPMPIGDMELIPLVDAIAQSKNARGGMTRSEMLKVNSIRSHISSGDYCSHLLVQGKLSYCEDPEVPKITVPVVEPSQIYYDNKNYVYKIGNDPYHYWDYQGDDTRNKRYCHGMVAAAKGNKSGNMYNHHLKDGYFTCDSSLVKGLPGNGAPKCWCNPNYDWSDYTKDKPYVAYGALGGLAYTAWDKQAKLHETRNCNGIVAIVDSWHTWSHKYQNALVAKMSGNYKCSYSAFRQYDWMTDEENTSWLGGAACYCNPKK